MEFLVKSTGPAGAQGARGTLCDGRDSYRTQRAPNNRSEPTLGTLRASALRQPVTFMLATRE